MPDGSVRACPAACLTLVVAERVWLTHLPACLPVLCLWCWSEGCMHHDWAYCECDKIYTNSNRVPPNSILIALRGSLPANQTASIDRSYLK